MSLDERLNSLTDSMLGDLLESDNTPTSEQQKADIVETTAQQRFQQSLEILKTRLELLQKRDGRKNYLIDIAWLCENCLTINGFSGTRFTARKTCSKCARPRTNDKTLALLLMDEPLLKLIIENSKYSLIRP